MFLNLVNSDIIQKERYGVVGLSRMLCLVTAIVHGFVFVTRRPVDGSP